MSGDRTGQKIGDFGESSSGDRNFNRCYEILKQGFNFCQKMGNEDFLIL